MWFVRDDGGTFGRASGATPGRRIANSAPGLEIEVRSGAHETKRRKVDSADN